MKKIIVMVTVITVAIISNAATFKWSGANIYKSDLTTLATGTAAIYAYANGQTVNDAVKVVDAFIVGGIIKSDAAGTAVGYTANWTAAVVGTTYNFFMIIEDGGKTFDSSSSSPAVIKTGAAQATATTGVSFGTMAVATQTAGNWEAAAVPEPTSGLLLLLGMAGLALKRKIA